MMYDIRSVVRLSAFSFALLSISVFMPFIRLFIPDITFAEFIWSVCCASDDDAFLIFALRFSRSLFDIVYLNM